MQTHGEWVCKWTGAAWDMVVKHTCNVSEGFLGTRGGDALSWKRNAIHSDTALNQPPACLLQGLLDSPYLKSCTGVLVLRLSSTGELSM